MSPARVRNAPGDFFIRAESRTLINSSAANLSGSRTN